MTKPIVVAGHICMDLIPAIPAAAGGFDDIVIPGKLVNVGPAIVATGGAVSNTGLALHKLGFEDVRLQGKVGDDEFGKVIVDVVGKFSPSLAESMIVVTGENSSYTVVLNPPNCDRVFFHYPGANDTFVSSDVNYDDIADAGLFHFGYPSLMRQMYLDDAKETADMFAKVAGMGVTTSLDMTLPDPQSESGQIDWQEALGNILPNVDVFLPSLDEIVYMLAPQRCGEAVSRQLLSDISEAIIEMGSAVAVIKLGDKGLYVRVTDDRARLEKVSLIENVDEWVGAELYHPCFNVDVVGTTGSGDCTIAGFLAGLVSGKSPQESIRLAVATGACNVEAADSLGGIKHLDEIQARFDAGWSTIAGIEELEELIPEF